MAKYRFALSIRTFEVTVISVAKFLITFLASTILKDNTGQRPWPYTVFDIQKFRTSKGGKIGYNSMTCIIQSRNNNNELNSSFL